jgi:hypothetical protein
VARGGHAPAALAYAVLTLAFTWPVVLSLGSVVPHDLGDPLLSTWTLWWNAQVVPFTEGWWRGLAFYPAADTLSYSDHRVGLSLITAPLILAGVSPLAAHNVAFVLSFLLSALSAYALAYSLTRDRAAAFVGGLVFGFHPFRAEHLSHLELLSSYWLPIVLLVLHRWTGAVAAPAAALDLSPGAPARPWPPAGHALWLVALSCALSLQALTCGYYFVFSGVLIGLWLVWFCPRDLAAARYAGLAAALAAPLVILAPVFLRYRAAHAAQGLVRSITEIETLSADVIGLLTPPAQLAFRNFLGGWRTPEGALFPGVGAVALVALALWQGRRRGAVDRGPRWRRASVVLALVMTGVALVPALAGPVAFDVAGLQVSVSDSYKPFTVAVALAALWFFSSVAVRQAWRTHAPLPFYVLATVAMWGFALGPTGRALGERMIYKAPYSWLMALPGFADEFRAPARFAMLAALTLAIAAALAFDRLMRARPRRLRTAALALTAFVVLTDGWIDPLPMHAPPRALAIPRGVPAEAVVIELPFGVFENAAAMYRSIAHGRRTINGLSGYEAPHYQVLRVALEESAWGAIATMARDAPVAVFASRRAMEPDAVTALVSATGARRIATTADHEVLLVPQAGQPVLGTRIAALVPIDSIRASANAGAASRMLDSDRRTAWESEGPQSGGEEIVLDLGAAHQVSEVSLAQGAFMMEYPRLVAVDLSLDGGQWSEVRRADMLAATLSAAIDDPAQVRVRLAFAGQPARYVRIRQLGRSDQPWAIAEIGVLAAGR